MSANTARPGAWKQDQGLSSRLVRNLRHAPGENVSDGPYRSFESRTATVSCMVTTSMHSPVTEALLFRHDAGSGLFGSDIEPLFNPQETPLLMFTFCELVCRRTEPYEQKRLVRMISSGTGDTRVTS